MPTNIYTITYIVQAEMEKKTGISLPVPVPNNNDS